MAEYMSVTENKLLDILADSDILIDELFHLQNFNTIVNYNPSPDQIILNKESESFSIFKNDNNLNVWPQNSKRSTRNATTTQNSKLLLIKERLSSRINDKIREKLENDTNCLGKRKKDDFDSTSVNKKQKTLNKTSKVKFRISVKPQIVTHPDHIPVHQFNSTEELFGSYRNVLEDPAPEIETSEYKDYLESQVSLVNKIKNAIEDKELLYIDYNENPFRPVPNGVREPTMIKRNPAYHINNYKPPGVPFRIKNDLTHYDHLLAQAMKSSKLIHDTRALKIQKCKRIAQMIELHFKRLSQENEKQEKEFRKKIVRLAKDTAREVKKKWNIALKAYKILEEREKERERMLKSKEQLSKILDHSTKVLGAQLVGKSISNTPSLDPEDRIEAKSENSEHDGGDSDDESSDEMLSSSSEDDDDDENNDAPCGDRAIDNVDDSKLTVEQLKEKYKHLESIKIDGAPSLRSTSLAEIYKDDSSIGDKSSHSRENDDTKTVGGVSAKSILDDDNDSYSISDESMSESSSDGGSDDEDNESEKAPGLADLFATNENKDSDDEDDESVYSDHFENETPSSSPEHPNQIESVDMEMTDDGIPSVPTPVLLKGTLRPYQKQGLNWLASLYNNGTNGILADEMGLGKTIQTISLLSYLACEKNEWGPHLIVVPTSVMLNWEMEFKRFAPGFKVLTYYGSPQQRKEKRKGWNTPDTFHVCITSYQLVVHDQPIFRRKKWKYMILDEAHNIKNFKSQRWKALLNFNTEHRVLLTGTPLQNNIIELWSLLYFLMPSSKEGNASMPEGFADLMNFQQWFGKPVDKIIQQGTSDRESKETVNKLHQVLRPYLLRRLKQDVEKQMPAKYEHIVYCRLSKRQRLLYDDFMSRAQTKETLASGNFLSIINCLMQLRKVCNHPDLFEVRPILTSFSEEKAVSSNYEIKNRIVEKLMKFNTTDTVNLSFLNLVSGMKYTNNSPSYHLQTICELNASNVFTRTINELEEKLAGKKIIPNYNDLESYYEYLLNKENSDLLELMKYRRYVNDFNCNKSQLLSSSLVDMLTLRKNKNHTSQLVNLDLVKSIVKVSEMMSTIVDKFAFVTPKAVCLNIPHLMFPADAKNELIYASQSNRILNPFHQAQVKTSIAFPDKFLLQYDCGKLQKLAKLLHDLIPAGHRVLIFTQMSKVLDILELFLNFNGYTYMRLDGATKIEDRQLLTERFNNDPRVKCFILSTRAGGLGINLTGADTVIFYDSDWNPAIDKQCQDRCHRIGQTRDVHIYRFVSEYTIEANILKKAEQKKHLDDVIIQEGDFTTDYFTKLTVQDLLGKSGDTESDKKLILGGGKDFTKALEMAEDVEDAKAAEIAMKESNVDVEDFSDEENRGNVGRMDSEPTPVEESAEIEKLATRVEELSTHHHSKQAEEVAETIDNGLDDEIGHIDEYMIRFIAGGYYFD